MDLVDLAIEIFIEIAEDIIPVICKWTGKLFKSIGRFFVWLFGVTFLSLRSKLKRTN